MQPSGQISKLLPNFRMALSVPAMQAMRITSKLKVKSLQCETLSHLKAVPGEIDETPHRVGPLDR